MHLYIGANPLKRHFLCESGCVVSLRCFRRHLASFVGTPGSPYPPAGGLWGCTACHEMLCGEQHTGNGVRDGGRVLCGCCLTHTGCPSSLGGREGALRVSTHIRRCPSVGTEVGHRSWERGEEGKGPELCGGAGWSPCTGPAGCGRAGLNPGAQPGARTGLTRST